MLHKHIRHLSAAFLAIAAIGFLLSPGSAKAESYHCDPAYIDGKIVVGPALSQPVVDGSTGTVNLCDGGIYAWNSFISLNWPAQSGARDVPDTSKSFGANGVPTVWETFRNKVELYPGNGSATTPPHGVTLPVSKTGYPYGYSDPPLYSYAPTQTNPAGLIAPCEGEKAPTTPAYVNLDETTQIGNDLLFAGVVDNGASKVNSQPRLVRYAAKMSTNVYANVIAGQFWYNSPAFAQAQSNYTSALPNQQQDPAVPYVNLGPANPPTVPNQTSLEVKSSWRQLTRTETASGHFHMATVRYYEKGGKGATCYREAVWGLIGMHLISFTQAAPWVIWSTFEQADNILDTSGKPTEDANGAPVLPAAAGVSPTTPVLTSSPTTPAPTVAATGEACSKPGKRLYFHENPTYGTLPANQDICVNARWHPIPVSIQQMNAAAHKAIATAAAKSPWQYYKLINVQPVPIGPSGMDGGRFSTTSSYYLSNMTIETDYSLGNFTGNLVNGVPSDVTATPGQQPPYTPYYNTQLLPFQALRFFGQPIQMGGCAGCHGFAASQGTDFSFALLGNTVAAPELPDAFAQNAFRNYIRK